LDKSLLIWFKQVRVQQVPVDGPLPLEKANKLLRDMGSDHTVCRAWIDGWKKRHLVGSQRMVGESSAVNMTEVNKWKTEVLELLLMKYPKENVFNMDETGLFYRLMTISFKGEKCSGGELSNERITGALCANMLGTEKMEPIVIGKYGKPRCFKNVTNLPCVYKFNKKA